MYYIYIYMGGKVLIAGVGGCYSEGKVIVGAGSGELGAKAIAIPYSYSKKYCL